MLVNIFFENVTLAQWIWNFASMYSTYKARRWTASGAVVVWKKLKLWWFQWILSLFFVNFLVIHNKAINLCKRFLPICETLAKEKHPLSTELMNPRLKVIHACGTLSSRNDRLRASCIYTWGQDCHTGCPEAFWQAYRAGGQPCPLRLIWTGRGTVDREITVPNLLYCSNFSYYCPPTWSRGGWQLRYLPMEVRRHSFDPSNLPWVVSQCPFDPYRAGAKVYRAYRTGGRPR
jgi:hypothetical protein